MNKKIYFHPVFIFCMMIMLITGYIKPFLLLFSIFFIHEMGHILASQYYHWKIKKIMILPFGGLTIFEESLNRPMKEEFIIVIMGPIFQILGFYILSQWYPYPYFQKLHMFYLLFNLMPIYPLDGSKLLLLVFQKILPFYTSYLNILWVSFIFVSVLILYMPFNLVLWISLLFLLKSVFEESKKIKLVFSKFLLERYLNQYHFKKYEKIKKAALKKMKRDKNHIFYLQNKWLTETTILKKWFDK